MAVTCHFKQYLSYFVAVSGGNPPTKSLKKPEYLVKSHDQSQVTGETEIPGEIHRSDPKSPDKTSTCRKSLTNLIKLRFVSSTPCYAE